MCASGLKVNATKCSLGLNYIPYLGYLITQQGIKPDPEKVQGIRDLRIPTTTTQARVLIGIVHYYRYMCPRRSRILAPLKEAVSGPKGRKILWNDTLEDSFKELKHMVSVETLLGYTDWTITFTVYTYASDKQLGDVISQNNKPIAFFSRRKRKAQLNYTITKKEILVIFECFKQFCGIISGYEINVFLYHKIWYILQP